MTIQDYNIFVFYTKHKKWKKPYVDTPIFEECLRDFLVYPHESKNMKNIKYNECLQTLPKLQYFTGPRIIYNSAQKPLIHGKNIVKLVYKLNHAPSVLNARILIIEYVLISRLINETWADFTNKTHIAYNERL